MRRIIFQDTDYPKPLKEIADAPRTLYLRGKLPLGNYFAIVGTRRCSDYGKEIAFSISQDLARAGLIIVSGMAKGIDTFSHKGALEAGGKTIAVLGTGLNEKSIYPQENLNLAKEILAKEGCLISEYEAGVHGDRFTFPNRNRIISGLSLGVLVVEAKYRSGALITAKWARQQNRKVFAVPGPVLSQNSKGPHLLIRQGAKLVETAQDILKELNIPCLTYDVRRSVGHPLGENNDEQIIIEILSQGSAHIEKIIEQSGLSPQQVSALLSLMEIDNKVKSLGGNTYVLVRSF